MSNSIPIKNKKFQNSKSRGIVGIGGLPYNDKYPNFQQVLIKQPLSARTREKGSKFMGLKPSSLSKTNSIEALPDGSFVFYPHGKVATRINSGRYYIDSYRSRNEKDLDKVARIYRLTARWGFLPLFFMFSTFSKNPSLPLIAILSASLLLLIVIQTLSPILARLFKPFFATVEYIAEEVNDQVAQDLLSQIHRRKPSSVVKFLPSILLAAIICFMWTMIASPNDRNYLWNPFVIFSPFLVLAGSFFATLSLFFLVQSLWLRSKFSKFLGFIYLVFSLLWIGILYSLPSPLAYFPPAPSYEKKAGAGVEWRTEIKRSDEPDTWPFKESSYMLSCLGVNGNYSVYLVRTEDITYKPDRSADFVAEYFGLKGNAAGWKDGRTQLLEGQTDQVFQRYVERSLELCKNVEAARGSDNPAPVNK
ncbi:MAG: hypothetical protein EOP04_05715 [Proteobacteria bacterium]|nr:MAG: hypothetical protein EOP04_05715 [Pseudomonadota bacterium]